MQLTIRMAEKHIKHLWQLYASAFQQKCVTAKVVHLGFLLGTGTLLGQKHGLDVGQHTTLGNGHACQELVQFLIVPGHKAIVETSTQLKYNPPDGELQMPWNNP